MVIKAELKIDEKGIIKGVVNEPSKINKILIELVENSEYNTEKLMANIGVKSFDRIEIFNAIEKNTVKGIILMIMKHNILYKLSLLIYPNKENKTTTVVIHSFNRNRF